MIQKKKTNQKHDAVDWTKWNIEISDPKKTGLRLFKVTPNRGSDRLPTSVTFAEFNSKFDVHATTAWAGARTSRSDANYEDIFAEIKQAADQSKYSSGEKLAKVFVNYGHASVAGMAPAFLYINQIPLFLPFWIFNHLHIGDGQELSTRYVKFTDLGIPAITELVDLSSVSSQKQARLQADWIELQQYLVGKYDEWNSRIRKAHIKQFKGEQNEAPLTESTLTARTLDIARLWIPAGTATSMAMLNSVRMWVDLVVQLREYPAKVAQELADQITAVLSLGQKEDLDVQADLHGLTKYAYARGTVTDNRQQLEKLLKRIKFDSRDFDQVSQAKAVSSITDLYKIQEPGESVIANYILKLYPTLNYGQLLEWLRKLTAEQQESLGEQVLKGHYHHDILRNAADVRGNYVMEIKTAMAYARDLNRHRAWGRFVPLLETQNMRDTILEGWHDNYQLQVTTGLKKLRSEFNDDMQKYYRMLLKLFDEVMDIQPGADQSFILYLLPMGHQVRMLMSAPVGQQVYAISQRVAGGGDFGYRHVMMEMLGHLRQQPYLSGMLPHINFKIDPSDRQQFIDRS